MEDMKKPNLINPTRIGKNIAEFEPSNKVDIELGSSKEFFNNIFNACLDGILVGDPDGYVTMANEAAAQILGYPQDEMVGKHPLELGLTPSEEKESGRDVIENLLEKGSLHGLHRRWIRKDGTSIDIEMNLSLMKDNNGNIVGSVGSFRDITETKKIESKLRAARDFSEDIVESSLDAIVLTDEHGYVTNANSAFCQLTGYGKADVLEKHMSQFAPIEPGNYHCTTGERIQIDKEFGDNIGSRMTGFSESGKLKNKVGFYLRKDKKIVPVESNIVFLFGSNGEKRGAFAAIRDITIRRKAEIEVTKTKDYLENIFRTSVDGIIVTGSNGKITSVNKAVEKTFDCSSDQLVGKHFNEMRFERESLREEGLALMDELMSKGTISGVERAWKKPNGSPVDVEMNIALLKDDEGNMTGSVASIRDITDRKKAEEALKESEEKYHNLIELANDAIVSINMNGMIIGFNKKAEEMFCYSREEVIGKPAYLLISQRTQKNYNEALMHFEKTGTGIEIENNVLEGKGVRKGGAEFQVEYSYYTINIKEAFIATAIIRDITDRKKAEEALRKSEEKYHDLIEHANDAIISSNSKGIIVGFNRRAEQMFGYSREEILGKSAALLVAEQSKEKQQEEWKKLQEIGNTYSSGQRILAWTALRKNGEEFPVEFTFYATETGGEVIANSIIRDVSQRKEEERKLIHYQKKLKDLTKALVLAEQNERQHFADFLHDEIGQQLFATRLQLELLKGSISSVENTKTLDNALNSLSQVMNQTRSLTSELSSPILKQLGLEKALEWLAEETYKKYDIRITFEDDRQEKPLDDNMKILLYQAVSELLTNIAKHAQTKNASVSIKKHNSSVQICVEDNGVGFYHPTDKSFPTMSEGVGLFRLMERLEPLGGQLEIKSQPNRGTKVSLVAPLGYNSEEQKT